MYNESRCKRCLCCVSRVTFVPMVGWLSVWKKITGKMKKQHNSSEAMENLLKMSTFYYFLIIIRKTHSSHFLFHRPIFKKSTFQLFYIYVPSIQKCSLFSKFLNFKAYVTNYWTNTRHVGTHLNAFLMVISNIVMKLYNFDIFGNNYEILDLLSAHASCVGEPVETFQPIFMIMIVKTHLPIFCNIIKLSRKS